uniref:Secreted protein n=3 Tax=Sar TaxID=2698737 RepID=A0A7S2SPK3_9STRA|mmetsp:Transcript_15269/g.24815  ORF Transcript_15269/g.24815 Transcript_15269/m.24815 type:complete len:290 (-) Transcript_15269:43-912(-)
MKSVGVIVAFLAVGSANASPCPNTAKTFENLGYGLDILPSVLEQVDPVNLTTLLGDERKMEMPIELSKFWKAALSPILCYEWGFKLPMLKSLSAHVTLGDMLSGVSNLFVDLGTSPVKPIKSYGLLAARGGTCAYTEHLQTNIAILPGSEILLDISDTFLAGTCGSENKPFKKFDVIPPVSCGFKQMKNVQVNMTAEGVGCTDPRNPIGQIKSVTVTGIQFDGLRLKCQVQNRRLILDKLGDFVGHLLSLLETWLANIASNLLIPFMNKQIAAYVEQFYSKAPNCTRFN